MFSYGQQLITGTCIMQALIYMCLLTITCLHNKTALLPTMGIGNSRHINNYVDYASMTLHDMVNLSMPILQVYQH